MNEYRIAQAVYGRGPACTIAAIERAAERARRACANDPSTYARAQIADTLARERGRAV